MKFGTLLNSLAKKSGIDTAQKEFIDLLSTDIEIPDAIANGIDRGLMNLDAAKANADVRKAIRTEALNGVDSKVAELLEELGIEDKADIDGTKNSYDKISKLAHTVKALEAKKATSGKGADKDAYERQIAELNNQIKEVKTSLTAKEKEYQQAREDDLTNFEMHKKLVGKNYALPAEMDGDLKLNLVQSAVNKELSKKGFKLVRDAENGSLKLVNKEGVPAYNDKNEPLEIDSFIDGALAQNKLLKVNDQSQQQQQQGGGNTASHTTGNGGQQQNPQYQQIVQQLDQQIAEMTA